MTPIGAERRLAHFEGAWRLERKISDDLGPNGVFEGEAIWAPVPDGARLTEKGLLKLNGQKALQAERSYVWRDDLTVWFPDGRFFHSVPLHGGETEHWCDPDMYRVAYDFSAWPKFQTIWTVSGPRKSYRMVSVYKRA